MLDYKINLTKEEEAILNGEKGEMYKKIMESIVRYGEIFHAEKLVDISKQVYLVNPIGGKDYESILEIIEKLLKSECKLNMPFTVNSILMDYDNIKVNPFEKLTFNNMYNKQKEYKDSLKKLGAKFQQDFICTCYMKKAGNMPKEGDILAWSQASAVAYANSVIGAKSNRNTESLSILSGIIGKIPYFGLLLDDNRKASWKIELRTKTLPNPQVLGSAIGYKVMEEVPYIVGLDRFLGNELGEDAKDYLKDMAASVATNGAVALFHVENLTPEAKSNGHNLLKEEYKTYIIDDLELEKLMVSYKIRWRDVNADAKLCFIGCPKLSLNQVYNWSNKIQDILKDRSIEKIKVNTVLCAAPQVIEAFKEDKTSYKAFINTGAKLSSIDPIMYMNNPLCSKKTVVTNSNKLRNYSTARFYLDDEILEILVKGRFY